MVRELEVKQPLDLGFSLTMGQAFRWQLELIPPNRCGYCVSDWLMENEKRPRPMRC